MSDIDDILNELGSASSGPEGPARYIPNPQDFVDANAESAHAGWEGMKQAGTDIWNQGAGPVNVGQAALAGLQYLTSPLMGLGRYLGNPVERGVSDLTGSPVAGKVIGDTVALAPSMAMPFPGSKMMSTAAEGTGLLLGETQAARSASGNVAPFIASKFAPSAAAARSDIDDILDEASGATRTTTKGKSIEDELALKWYADQFKGGGGMEDLPPLNPASRKTIRLLEKGNPKVGENKYARNEAGEQTTMSYENQGERPTYRTSAQPAEATRDYPPVWYEGGHPMTNLGTIKNADPAPLMTYENAFRREFEPDNVALGTPPSQTPLGSNPKLDDMYLPNVRENAELDPKLLAELKLKFGGSGDRGVEPWVQQQAASTYLPGAKPMPPQQTVVQFPSGNQPVAMGKEARSNTNRLREDLGLPPDAKETVRGRAPIPDNPGTAAKPGLSNFGEVEVGQPYDIVHAVGANEMRAPGGVVKEMVTVNEPVIKNGKMTYEPMVYGMLEDGRKVPAKMLKPAGAQQPNVSAMGESAPRTAPAASSPAAAADNTADPAFDKVREAMQKRVDEAVGAVGGPKAEVINKRTYDPKDINSVIKAIKDARPTTTTPVYFSELQEKIPGVSKAMLDRAYSKIKEKNPDMLRNTDPEKGQYFSVSKIMKSKLESKDAKAEVANRAIKIATEDGKLNEVYLRNLRPHIVQRKNKTVEVGEVTMVRHLNKMLRDGEISVHPESAPDQPLTKITSDILGGDHEEDYVVKFLKKTKKAKADQ